MRKVFLVLGAVFVWLVPAGGAGEPRPLVREIFVPFADLDVLLENQPQRVLLSRSQYEALLAKAVKAPESRPPEAALLLSADYVATLEEERARLEGKLSIEVLDDGLQSVALDFSGVGLRRALLDGKPASLARLGDGRLVLLVEGKGRHELALELVAPLETTAARQVLSFRLPQPASARFRLTVPGDVEVRSGAGVASRAVDPAANLTRFELVPGRGDTTLVLTLNSRLQRRQRAVVARSVLVDELTQAYERLHATVSLGILHQAVDRFRFVVPEGFEVTEVASPLVSRWAIETEDQRRVLDVRLREPTIDTVVLSLSATRPRPPLDKWSLPRLEPLDVVGQVAVVGLLVEDRLGAEAIEPSGLIPINVSVFGRAIPESVLRAEPGAPSLRPVVAYYAPQAQFGLKARFPLPPAEITVRTNVLLTLGDRAQEVRGCFLLVPAVEKLFAFDFSVPAGWHVLGVTGPDEKPLAFERFQAADQQGRIQIRLPQGIAPGQKQPVYFVAKSTPSGWLGDWESTKVSFPVFAVAKATRDAGAVAVAALDDMLVRPESAEGLAPLAEGEKPLYGLAGVATSLAYRYERPKYSATLEIRRARPRLTARTFSFLRVESDALAAHYEVVYRVEEARARQLSLLLPQDTPAALRIVGLDNVKIKEFQSRDDGKLRRWTVHLEEPRRGTIRLGVDFQQPLPVEKSGTFALPLVLAGDVAYQSGLVAVEGSAELDVQVTPDARARRVDVGELVDARHQPGPRLLGAFGFAGDPAVVSATVARHPGYGLYPTIVEKATLHTALSAGGVSQTSAEFALRTKALYLQIELPDAKRSELWSVLLDDKPLKPQHEEGRILVSLPAAMPGEVRRLKVIYQTPVEAMALTGTVSLPAPRLLFRADRQAAPEEVPVADLAWHVILPSGYELVRSRGTVVTPLEPPEPAALTAAKAAAGLFLWRGSIFPTVYAARQAARRPVAKTTATATSPYYIADDVQHFEQAAPAKASRRMVPSSSGRAGPGDMTLMRKGVADYAGQKPAEAGEGNFFSADALYFSTTAKPEPKVDLPPATAPEPATPPQPPPGATEAPPSEKAAEAVKAKEDQPKPTTYKKRLEGFSSLQIDLAPTPDVEDRTFTFTSLGVDPRLEITLVDRRRLDLLGWGLALGVGLVGLARTNRPIRTKTRLIVLVVVLGTLVPLVPGGVGLAAPANLVVFAACLLIPYYLLAAVIQWLVPFIVRRRSDTRRPAAAAAGLLLVVLLAGSALPAEPPAAKTGPYVIQVVEPPEPVKVPEDAVLVPYDPDAKTGVQEADRMLVPYGKYVELWNRAYPDRKLEVKPPPAPYGLGGVSYAATLQGDDYLLVEGHMEIDVLSQQFVQVPLALGGGVLARAQVDGKPARLSVVPAPEAALAVQVSGKGRHRLELSVRMKLERRGGWRVVEGTIPWAPAASLALVAPDAQTEIRLGDVPDRRSYETQQAGQRIETALAPGGRLLVQWRPKVAEGQVDRSLTAQSNAVLDVQEDGLRLVWQVELDFRRTQRESFTLDVPAEYLVEKVEGGNVRGWEIRKEAGRQSVEVSLLKAARDRESLLVRLWRAGAVGTEPLARFDAPVVAVAGAALQSGRLTLRRSPLLDVRTLGVEGLTRTDLAAKSVAPGKPPAVPGQAGAGPGQPAGAGAEDSPLGIRPYEAYQFATTPYALRLAAAPIAGRTTAQVLTILKIASHELGLESRIVLEVRDRPIHRVDVLLPEGLRLDQVTVPGDFQWAVVRQEPRSLLTVYLAAGRLGEVPVLLRGSFDRPQAGKPIVLPRIDVQSVERQQGDFAVQADPGFDVTPEGLQGCQVVLRDRISTTWLKPEQVETTALALHYDDSGYRGALGLVPRKSLVSCDTVTNVLVTDRAVEETILLDFNVEQAGIRRLTFLLPARMKDSRIQVPMLREKPVPEPIGPQPGSPVRVRLELQDAIRGKIRVLVENDHLLGRDGQETAQAPAGDALPDRALESAPIPRVDMELTSLRQFVALQSAGRDEVVVEAPVEMDAIGRQQDAWRVLQAILQGPRGGITQAFVVQSGAKAPELKFRTRARPALETAGARIGLAETTLLVDAHGAYRATTVLRMNNATEQSLDVELPEGAVLWTAQVARAPVKPTRVPGVADPRRVLIPLVKTAAGDSDYPVVLKYGGWVRALGPIGSVRFPLPRTMNVAVEESHVRLYLPETFEWFRFTGTMRQAAGEDDLVAGRLSYQTKAVKRLMDIARQDDAFARARASYNLKAFVDASDSTVASLKYNANAMVQQELAGNTAVARLAKEELQREGQAAARGEVFEDNRRRMNDLYVGQKVERARDAVVSLGANWDFRAAPAATTPAQPGAELNPFWLDKNKLHNAGLPGEAGQGQEPGAKTPGAQPAREGDQRGQAGGGQPGLQQRIVKGQDKSMPDQSEIRGPAIQQVQPPTSTRQPAQPQEPKQEQAGNIVQRYQQRLQEQAALKATGAQHGAASQDKTTQSQVYALTMSNGRDVVSVLQSVMPDIKVSLDPRTNGVVVQATPDQQAAVKSLLTQLDSASDVSDETDVPRVVKLHGRQDEAVLRRALASVLRGTDGAGPGVDGAGPGVVLGEGQLRLTGLAGLASLDVNLPERGTVYLFTTPGGDVEITGWEVSQGVLSRGGRTAAVAVLLVVVLGMVRLARGGAFRWLARPAGAVLLVCLGVLALLTGFLAAALVLLAAGVIPVLRRRALRPALPPAPPA